MKKNQSLKTTGFHQNSSTNTSGSFGRSFFLGIGINDYQNFEKIHNAVKDVNDIANVLYDKYQFIDEEPSKLVFDQNATRDNILSSIRSYCNKKEFSKDDRLLIYYSGHGHWDETTKIGYWVPVDGDKSKLHSSCISNYEIRPLIRAMNFRHILLISDSCFSGSLLVRGTKSIGGTIGQWEREQSRYVFASGKGLVYDGEPGTNSPFSAAILKNLTQSNEPLNIQLLGDRVTKLVGFNYAQKAEIAPLQNAGHEGGQFIFYPRQLDHEEWFIAGEINTIQVYQEFVDKHPESEYINQAYSRIQNLLEQEELKEWVIAREQNTIEALERFVKNFDKSKFVPKARQQIKILKEIIEDKEWRLTMGNGTIEAYEKFIENFPGGQHFEEAKRQLYNLRKEFDWQKARKNNTIEAYTKIIKKYPTDNISSEARLSIKTLKKKQERDAWDLAKEINTIIAYEKFIRKYPKGRYSSAAKENLDKLIMEERLVKAKTRGEISKIVDQTNNVEIKQKALKKLKKVEDDIKWGKAQKSDTLSGYYRYLDSFPPGAYVDEARKKIKSILDADTQSKDSHGDQNLDQLNTPSAKLPPHEKTQKNDKSQEKRKRIGVFIKNNLLFARILPPKRIGIFIIAFSLILVLFKLATNFIDNEEKAFRKAMTLPLSLSRLEAFRDQFPNSRYRSRIDEEVKPLRDSLKIALNNKDVMENIGNMAKQKKFTEEALLILPDSLPLRNELKVIDSLIKEEINILLNNSKVYFKLENLDKLRKTLEEILKLDPKNEEALKLLNEVNDE